MCPDVHFADNIAVPATSATLPDLERFSAHTTSRRSGVAVAIVDNEGTIAFDGRGPIPAFIFGQAPWSPAGTTIFRGLGIEDGTWYPFWLHCFEDGRLTAFYGAVTDTGLGFNAQLEGRCDRPGEWQDVHIDVPAHELREVALTCGFSVAATPSGVPIDLGSSRPGSANFEGRSTTILPFHAVDCRTGCSESGSYELYSILSSSARSGFGPDDAQVGFLILHLSRDFGDVIHGYPGFLLPAGVPFTTQFPGAVWTLDR